MKRKLNWKAHTSKDRQQVIEQVKSSLSAHDAFVINFNMYSDLALTMMIEVSQRNILELHADLERFLTISKQDMEAIHSFSDREWTVFLNISFSSGTGRLEHERPSVP